MAVATSHKRIEKGDPSLIWAPYPKGNAPVLFDVRGHRRSASMFFEYHADTNRDPVFTVKDYDFNGCKSAYNLYINSIDEYDAAMKMVGSMSHWRKLIATPWFLEGDPDIQFMGLAQWRRDMAARDASVARQLLMENIKKGDMGAAKFMLTYATKGDIAGTDPKKKQKVPNKNKKPITLVKDHDAKILDLVTRLSEGSANE